VYKNQLANNPPGNPIGYAGYTAPDPSDGSATALSTEPHFTLGTSGYHSIDCGPKAAGPGGGLNTAGKGLSSSEGDIE